MILNYFDDVPPEIWEQALKLVAHGDLHAISLTCRLFHDISKPMIFKRLAFAIPGPPSGDPDFSKSLPKIMETEIRLRNISNNDKYAKFVRNLHFDTHYQPKPRRGVVHEPTGLSPEEQTRLATEAYHTLLKVIEIAISRFSHLRKIALGPVPLKAELMQKLALLHHLEYVSIEDAEISYPTSTPLLRVKSFDYHEFGPMFGHHSAPIALPLVVAAESIQDMNLSGPRTDAILTSFIKQGSISARLSVLRIQMIRLNLHAFFNFLQLCPALEKLYITSYQNLAHATSGELSYVPSSIVPRLAYYVGPDAIGLALAPASPMTTTILINVTSNVLTTAEFTTLGRSSAPITTLSFGLRFMNRSAFHAMARYLPQLEKFTVHVQETEGPLYVRPEGAISYLDLLSELASNSLPLPERLRSLGLCQHMCQEPQPQNRSGWGLVAEPYPIEEQRTFLSRLSELYPDLREVSLGMRRVDWRMEAGGQINLWVRAAIPDMFPPLE